MDFVNGIIDNASNILNTDLDTIGGVLETSYTEVSNIVGSVGEGVKESIDVRVDGVSNIVNSFDGGFGEVVDTTLNEISNAASADLNSVKNTANTTFSGASNIIDSVGEGAKGLVHSKVDGFSNIVFGGAESTVLNEATNVFDSMVDGTTGTTGTILNEATNVVDSVVDVVDNTASAVITGNPKYVKKAFDGVIGTIDSAVDGYSNIRGSLYDSFGGTMNATLNGFSNIGDSIIGANVNDVDNSVAKNNSFSSGISNFFSTASGSLGSAVSAVSNNHLTGKTFSAKEIQRQSDRLKEQTVVLLAKIDGAKRTCMDIAEIVKNEDSNLANSWKKLAENLGNIKSKYENTLNKMIERMNIYSTKSIVNEELIERKTKVASSALDEVVSFLQNIDL